MAFTDWSSVPINNADMPGISWHDKPQTTMVYATSARQMMADLAALKLPTGADLIGYAPPYPGAEVRSVSDKLQEDLSILDFIPVDLHAAIRARTNTVPLDAYFDACKSALSAGSASIYYPDGTYLITEQVTWTAERLHHYGAGKRAAIIQFEPTVDDLAAFQIGTTATGGPPTTSCSIRGMTFYSSDTLYRKTALRVCDTSDLLIDQVETNGPVLGGTDMWQGGTGGSIGLELLGREKNEVRSGFFHAERPIEIGLNPNRVTALGIDADHLIIHNPYLIASGYPCIKIVTGVNLSNVVIADVAAVQGTAGVEWIDTTSTRQQNGLVIRNLRWEQASLVNGWGIDIQTNNNLLGLTLQDVFISFGAGGIVVSGIRLRKVLNPVLVNVTYGGSGVCLNIDSTVDRMRIVGCFWQAGCTASITGQDYVIASPYDPSTSPVPYDAVLNNSGSTLLDVRTDGALSGKPLVFANNQIYVIGAAVQVNATLSFYTSDGIQAEFELRAGFNTVTIIRDSSAVCTTILGNAGTWNVCYSAPNYVIENKRGVSRNTRIVLNGATVAL